MPGSEGGRLAGRPALASAQTGVQDEAEDKKPPAQKREVQWLVSPVTQLMTPGGMPAAAKHCTMSRPATEPWVGGFSTRVLPAIRAGPILLQQGVARGVQDAGFAVGGERAQPAGWRRGHASSTLQGASAACYPAASAPSIHSPHALGHPPDSQVDWVVEGRDGQHHAQGHLQAHTFRKHKHMWQGGGWQVCWEAAAACATPRSVHSNHPFCNGSL